MELKELIQIRRSCRKYIPSTISREDIEHIIKTTQMAASWKNSETGRYYVALSEEAVKEVYDCLPDFNQRSTVNACAYIVATFKKGISGNTQTGPSEQADIWGGYDLGLQNSYLMLQASELGYDTLIMGLRDEDRLRKFFNIPEDEIMLPVIAIGKKDGEIRLNPRKAIEEILTIK